MLWITNLMGQLVMRGAPLATRVWSSSKTIVKGALSPSAIMTNAGLYTAGAMIENALSDDLTEEEREQLMVDQLSYLSSASYAAAFMAAKPKSILFGMLPALRRVVKDPRVVARTFGRTKTRHTVASSPNGVVVVDDQTGVRQMLLSPDGKFHLSSKVAAMFKSRSNDQIYMVAGLTGLGTLLDQEDVREWLADYMLIMCETITTALSDSDGAAGVGKKIVKTSFSHFPLDMLLDDPAYVMRRISNELGSTDHTSDAVVAAYQSLFFERTGIRQLIDASINLALLSNKEQNTASDDETGVTNGTSDADSESDESSEKDDGSSYSKSNAAANVDIMRDIASEDLAP